MKILLLTSHSVAEYDDLRMFTYMGHDAFSIGAYSDPARPSDHLRPPLPIAPDHPELREACQAKREQYGSMGIDFALDWAKADLPEAVTEWADVVIIHHYLDRWLIPQWTRLRDRCKVIWRTCGQSNPMLEKAMLPLHAQGLRIVRYSPLERDVFTSYGPFAGEDAMIRFGKFLGDYPLWSGVGGYVANVTQDLAQRGDACGLPYWLQATAGLPARPAGAGSDQLPGGVGMLDYPDLLHYLQEAGAYVYMGTGPASYTLALIEAMAVGVPIHVMPRDQFPVPKLFEAPQIVGDTFTLAQMLADPFIAISESSRMRFLADQLFNVHHPISEQWEEVLRS
jgi:hypothetical protein